MNSRCEYRRGNPCLQSGTGSAEGLGRTEQRQGPAWWERTRGLCWWLAWAAWCFGTEDEAKFLLFVAFIISSFCCIYFFFGITDHVFLCQIFIVSPLFATVTLLFSRESCHFYAVFKGEKSFHLKCK